MKKIIFTIVLASILSVGAYAQFNQGRILVGGNIGFSSETQKSEFDGNEETIGTITTVSFSPNVGYFFIDNFAAGASLEVSSTTEKEDGSDAKVTTSEFTFNPFVRYYFGPGVFGQGSFGVGSAKVKEEDGSQSEEFKSSVSRWSIGLGYAIFLNDNVAIEPLIGYGSRSYKLDETGDPTTKYNGLFIQVGVQAYLGAK